MISINGIKVTARQKAKEYLRLGFKYAFSLFRDDPQTKQMTADEKSAVLYYLEKLSGRTKKNFSQRNCLHLYEAFGQAGFAILWICLKCEKTLTSPITKTELTKRNLHEKLDE